MPHDQERWNPEVDKERKAHGFMLRGLLPHYRGGERRPGRASGSLPARLKERAEKLGLI